MKAIRSPFLAGIAARLRKAAAESELGAPAPHPARRAGGRTPTPGAPETAIDSPVEALHRLAPRPPSRRS